MSANRLIDALGIIEATQAKRTQDLLAACRHSHDAAGGLLNSAFKGEPLLWKTIAQLAEALRLAIESGGLPLDDDPGAAGAMHAAALSFLRVNSK